MSDKENGPGRDPKWRRVFPWQALVFSNIRLHIASHENYKYEYYYKYERYKIQIMNIINIKNDIQTESHCKF